VIVFGDALVDRVCEIEVITAALSLLERAGEPIVKTLVPHTTGVIQAVQRLQTAFEHPPLAGRIALSLLPMQDEYGRALKDVETRQTGQAAFRSLYQAIASVKQASQTVHLCIAGGRKTLSLFGMAAAQMLFDEQDRLWHLYSGPDFLNSRRMFPQAEDEAQLIPIPVILWNRLAPPFMVLADQPDPQQALARIQAMQLRSRMEQARSFMLGSLTPAEQRVAVAMVRNGWSDKQLAQRLNLSERTIEQHLRSAYLKAAHHWELEDVNRASLVSLLNIYCVSLPEQNQGKTA